MAGWALGDVVHGGGLGVAVVKVLEVDKQTW